MEKKSEHVPIPFAPVRRRARARAREGRPRSSGRTASLIRRDGASGKVRWDAFHPAKRVRDANAIRRNGFRQVP